MRTSVTSRIARVVAAVPLAVAAAWTPASAQQPAYNKQHVTFPSGSLTLGGFVFKPNGPGPFPLVVWNHGSEHFPDRGPQFDSVAAVFVPAGYAVFAPMRRGHGDSQGTWVTTTINETRATSGMIAGGEMQVHLLETEQLDDQLAGLGFAKRLPFVDTTKVVVAGCSYGGIQTLLGAESGAYKAGFSISPAALSWRGNPLMQRRMVQAIDKIDVPVRIIQPPR